MLGNSRRLAAAVLAAAGCLAASHAQAHPHVWVTMRAAILFAPDGSMIGIRYSWTFDDMYSAFAVQGVKQKTKGVFTREELAPLAQTNLASLQEYHFFSSAKSSGRNLPWGEPSDYWNEYKDGILTLNFTLPFKAPLKAPKTVQFEVYDPTIFVDLELDDKQPVSLVGAPAQCKVVVDRPKELTVADTQKLGEAFFNTLTAASNFGAQFANTILVLCP